MPSIIVLLLKYIDYTEAQKSYFFLKIKPSYITRLEWWHGYNLSLDILILLLVSLTQGILKTLETKICIQNRVYNCSDKFEKNTTYVQINF